jgi:FHS family glucose/mannose:H+ symporter-like MFS transporter
MSETGPGRIRAGWLSVTAWSAMFGFGIVMALLGAILPLISARVHFDLAQAGNLFLAMNGAMLVTTLALGPLVDRFGLRPPLLIAPLFVAGALALIARVATFPALLAAVLLLGVGGGALNQASNTLIADLHENAQRKNAALNLLGVFFGIGALFVPFTIGAVLETLGFAGILTVALALSLLPAVLGVVLAFPRARQHAGVSAADVLRLAREPLVIAFSLLLFFQSGNEFILGGYLTSFLIRDLGATVATASWLLAAYWASLMTARIVLSRVLLRASGDVLIGASALGVAASVVLLLIAPSISLAAVAVVLLGLSIAAIFPTTLGLAGARFPTHSGTVFGILIGLALSGGMLLPWAAGRVAQSRGVRAGLTIPVVSALAIFALLLVSRRIRRTTNA